MKDTNIEEVDLIVLSEAHRIKEGLELNELRDKLFALRLSCNAPGCIYGPITRIPTRSKP